MIDDRSPAPCDRVAYHGQITKNAFLRNMACTLCMLIQRQLFLMQLPQDAVLLCTPGEFRAFCSSSDGWSSFEASYKDFMQPNSPMKPVD